MRSKLSSLILSQWSCLYNNKNIICIPPSATENCTACLPTQLVRPNVQKKKIACMAINLGV